jgi:hypothetical protein
MYAEEWTKRFCDRICAKLGEESRSQAERSAQGYMNGVGDGEEDDPEPIADSVMAWWDKRGEWSGEAYESIAYDVVKVLPGKVVLALPGVDWTDDRSDLKQVRDPPPDIRVGDQLIVRSDGIRNWSRSVRVPEPSSTDGTKP